MGVMVKYKICSESRLSPLMGLVFRFSYPPFSVFYVVVFCFFPLFVSFSYTSSVNYSPWVYIYLPNGIYLTLPALFKMMYCPYWRTDFCKLLIFPLIIFTDSLSCHTCLIYLVCTFCCSRTCFRPVKLSVHRLGLLEITKSQAIPVWLIICDVFN